MITQTVETSLADLIVGLTSAWGIGAGSLGCILLFLLWCALSSWYAERKES